MKFVNCIALGNCTEDKKDNSLLLGAAALASQTAGGAVTPPGTNPGTGTATFSIGGTITGLIASGLVLQNNASDDLTVASGATSFTFATKVSGTYAVTVKTQPTGLTCSVSSGSGTATANVTNVSVSCIVGVIRNWGTITDMKDGTIKFEGNAGTFGGQTYTAQTLYFAKCTHGQTYNATANDCTGTGSAPNYGTTTVQFCTVSGNSCNGNDANQPVSSGTLFNACNGLNLAGKTWRVPTKNELKLAIQCTDTTKLPDDGSDCGGSTSPAVISLFTNTVAGGYWSSTTCAPNTTVAWNVNFGNGVFDDNNKSISYYVRCVSGP